MTGWPLMSALSLYQAAVARAKASAGSRVLVFGETPPDEASRGRAYLIIDPDPGFDAVGRGDGRVSSRRGRFVVRCCGSSREQALLALDVARDEVFRDWRPFGSLRFGAARETDAGPLVSDESIPTDIRYSFTLVFDVDDD